MIKKGDRKLLVYDHGRLIEAFDVVLGSAPVGSKQLKGDGRTPEGEYVVCAKNPESKYHLSLCLSYPNAPDANRGLADGLISRSEYDEIVTAVRDGKLPPQRTALGGEIYIHGGGTDGDWTRGCVALADDEMTELFEMVELGTAVVVTP